ncbi:MAG: FecR domain-containing protein [Kiritimatiellae bacterium]|nr:FecR domain-containing protein [Kiritimatiellia bacterium]
MMIRKLFSRSVVCLAACAALTCAVAQEEAQDTAVENAEAVAEPQPGSSQIFHPLVMVARIQGVCEVLNPDIGSFTPAINGKAYPLGTVVRTGIASAAVLSFSAQDTVSLGADTEVVADRCTKNQDARVLRIVAGSAVFELRDNLPEGSFTIETANAVCHNVVGRGEYRVYKDGDSDVFQAATITGSARLVGPNYNIPALRAANTVNIMTAPNRALSRMTSVSGDFIIVLDKGLEEPVEYAMSPKAVVKIWRENAPVGGRTIISTLVVSPNGIAQHRFAYAEGRSDIATGELVTPEEDEIEMPVLLSDKPKKDGDDKDDAVEPKPADEN